MKRRTARLTKPYLGSVFLHQLFSENHRSAERIMAGKLVHPPAGRQYPRRGVPYGAIRPGHASVAPPDPPAWEARSPLSRRKADEIRSAAASSALSRSARVS